MLVPYVKPLLREYDEAEAMELFREEGREEACLTDLRNLIDSLECTVERALDLLCIPQEDRGSLLEQLS